MSLWEKCFCVWSEERHDLKLRSRREKLKQQLPVGLHVTSRSRVFQVLVTSVERGWRLDSCPFPHSQPSHEPRIILTPHKQWLWQHHRTTNLLRYYCCLKIAASRDSTIFWSTSGSGISWMAQGWSEHSRWSGQAGLGTLLRHSSGDSQNPPNLLGHL